MKKILFIFMLLGMVQSIMAQPAARRKQAQQKAQQSNADNMTLRAKLYFPTAIPMDEDVVWRRDIYRELNLTDDANAALYYPVEPTDGKMNLFTYIFKLMFTGRVPVYQYRMDGNEDFSAANRLTPKAFVDNYHIYYEKTDNGKVHIDDSDIPSAEVKAYYVKETSYYDQKTASFHTMPDRLLTRFSCGLVCELEKPNIQLCVDILSNKIRRDGLKIPVDVISFIAQTCNGSVRDLHAKSHWHDV